MHSVAPTTPQVLVHRAMLDDDWLASADLTIKVDNIFATRTIARK
jgi:hypothetical protein